jgi:hypothetical protein
MIRFLDLLVYKCDYLCDLYSWRQGGKDRKHLSENAYPPKVQVLLLGVNFHLSAGGITW